MARSPPTCRWWREGIAIQKKHLANSSPTSSRDRADQRDRPYLAYSSLDDREKRRAALMDDPDWRTFLPKIRDLIEVAENKIMKATRFSPTGGASPEQPIK
ncbi:NIPSNAP family protein (plasmid) [Sinorhizobium meliloti]|nr:NIPSNAP family protein [Sinorhizobium meliloti]